ncbi:Protein ecm33 [Neolecta irregularis DAH-3]|uniref:Protein ecm33 n=1 Tax=Neolecta irregularis (strain DAH-3) TaxID=1198029 RepID=A0A1U7LNS5_NEOID|nr:Protein ecm33 [Neolecta irregularis DAH-3]|eukprot:OLL24320.1 Protein ecm33 [Neolecta irregularis DAH-3]
MLRNCPVIPCLRFRSGGGACSNSNGFQIASQADLDALQDCQTVKGDVIVTRDLPSLSVPSGLTAIQGDFLVAQAISMTSLTASSLQSISGKFQLLNLTILTTLNMPSLTSVGTLDWTTVPALRSYVTAITTANSVSIIDTRLEDLSGFSLKSLGGANINNNRYMKLISLGNLSSATGAISVAFNAASASVDLSSLLSAGNVSLNNVGDVFIPLLANVSGSFSLHQCTSQKYAAPKLTLVQESFSIIDNSALTDISMPILKEAGSPLYNNK